MCGIAGSIGARRPDQTRIQATLAALRRRGPDAQGIAVRNLGNAAVTLLHTRLSIIDLDPRANQPFVQDGCTLIYNGELYNYVELRRELEALGRRFRTNSDTEVLLAAYLQWGTACHDRFEGMWTFALFDEKQGRLILSRDRFGEKPLYWRWLGKTLYFASEVKSLAALSGAKPTVNRTQLRRFLVNGYKALYKGTETFFEDVHEIPPASFAVLERAERPRPQRYWRLEYKPEPMSEADAIQGVRERLDESVRIRMRTDVPLAFCLSGGIDSAMLAGIAAKRLGQSIHCFSIIDSDPRYDESENIDATVKYLGCEVTKIPTSTSGFFDRMASLVTYHDAPVITISYYVHSFLPEAIAAKGYKVAVSGTAADELFTGYYDHSLMWLAEMRANGGPAFETLVADWRQGYGAHVRNPFLQDPLTFATKPEERRHIYLDAGVFAGLLKEPFDENFAETVYTPNLLRNRMMNELFNESIPVLLHEDDRNSMQVSIENRSPYLDRRLAEFAYAVPAQHLVKDGLMKWLLRAAGEGMIPDSVRLDKRKRGFNASIDSLINRKDAVTRAQLLENGPVFELVKREALETFLDGDMTSNSYSKFLFSFVSTKLFLEHYRGWAV